MYKIKRGIYEFEESPVKDFYKAKVATMGKLTRLPFTHCVPMI